MSNFEGAGRLEKWAPGLLSALATRSAQEQRDLALWCARQAITRAGIGDEPFITGALRQIRNGQQPPTADVLSAWVDDYVQPDASQVASGTSPVAIANLIGSDELRRNPYNSVTARIVSAPHLAVWALIAATDPDPLKAAVEALHYACATFSDDAPDFLHLMTETFTIESGLSKDDDDTDDVATGRGVTSTRSDDSVGSSLTVDPQPWFPEHQDNERLSALDRYGRVLIDHGVITLTAVGANPGYGPDPGLIRTAVDGHLEVSAGASGQWAAVRLVGHRERPTFALDDDEAWEQSEEAVVSFHGPPFVLFAGYSMSVGIEPSLQDLDISEGTYGVKVSARGIRESFTRQSGPIIDLDNAPPPQELGQQIRIDLWPTPYPYNLDYDPFSASVT